MAARIRHRATPRRVMKPVLFNKNLRMEINDMHRFWYAQAGFLRGTPQSTTGITSFYLPVSGVKS